MWSKKGLTSSYVGITVHFISKEGTLENVVLDVVLLPSPHTGKAIATLIKEALVSWKIVKNTSIAVTDNGSSMIKAFKDLKVMFDEEEEALPTPSSSVPEPPKDCSANGGKHWSLLFIDMVLNSHLLCSFF